MPTPFCCITLQVKPDGLMIGDLDLFHHRPYECLILGYCYNKASLQIAIVSSYYSCLCSFYIILISFSTEFLSNFSRKRSVKTCQSSDPCLTVKLSLASLGNIQGSPQLEVVSLFKIVLSFEYLNR